MTLNQDQTTGILKLWGSLQIAEVGTIHNALCKTLNQHEIAIDLSDVDQCDTAALQVLLAARETAAALGKAFRFTAVSDVVSRNATALGFSLTTTHAQDGN